MVKNQPHQLDLISIKTSLPFYAFFLLFKLSAQENNVNMARDGFLAIATDARAAGQGDIGVATSPDAFSQLWNPSKYVFSTKKFEVGITQIFAGKQFLSDFNQVSLNFYNKLDDRRAYALSFQNYSYVFDEFIEFGTTFPTHEVAISGSYTMKLSNEFAMSVGGRFISLKGKIATVDSFTGASDVSLYGVDISGYYYGNEVAYKAFNARWRAGFNFSNLRGKSVEDTKYVEIYAPALLRAGAGIDLIFDQDKQLGITTEYKMLLDSYTENEGGEPLDFGLTGSVMALGLEFVFMEKMLLRAGYSNGINRATDSFGSIGCGFKGRFVDLDIAILLGVSEEENQIRQKLRLSLGLNLDEVFSN